MVIMALDHVRDFFHLEAQQFQPDDLTRTSAALFLTRWITHICAPVFMFSAGAGAFLWLQKGHTPSQLSRYLWKRGVWLVLLELTVLRVALTLSFTGPVLLTILWALGWSMVALAFLSRLPVRVLAILSVLLIALHNLADSLDLPGSWKILHQQGVIQLGGHVIVVAYPLLPWIAVMAAGFCFGRILLLDPPARQSWLIRIGLALTAAFFVIRAVNIYGDPQRWSVQASPAFTVLSFLRCTKYPPSLDFLLMTLGPGLLLLAWFYRAALAPTHPLVIIGRVPLFYFLIHMYLAHALAALFGQTHDLRIVYLWWLAVVVLTYPLCLWFGRLKQRHPGGLLAYL